MTIHDIHMKPVCSKVYDLQNQHMNPNWPLKGECEIVGMFGTRSLGTLLQSLARLAKSPERVSVAEQQGKEEYQPELTARSLQLRAF